jgi:hypothetical protein
MVCLTLADAIVEAYGGDTMAQVARAVDGARARIRSRAPTPAR